MRNARKTGKTWLAILAAAALASPAVQAQTPVSLATVVDLARQNSSSVRLAEADVRKATARLQESRDVFIPSISFGSGLPAFPEVGFTGAMPTIWDSTVESMVFSMPQFQYIHAARAGLQSAELALKDAREQAALDAATAYIELDTVNRELAAAHEQEQDAARLVAIEQQRAEAGVDPLSALLEAQLAAAQIKLARLHLETRAATLAQQLAVLTGLPAGAMAPDRASIPEIPAVTGDIEPRQPLGVMAAQALAASRLRQAKGDEQRLWLLPEISFGAQYNRDTQLLNSIGQYFVGNHLPVNNFSSGFNITVPFFNMGLHAKSRESAAEAVRARVEADEARQQNDVEMLRLNASLRELDTRAEIARLKQQIAAEQLKSVTAEMELGNGSSAGPNATPQLSPAAKQRALIGERQKYIESLEAGLDLSKTRLDLLRSLGHMQDWLDELHTKP